MNILLLGATGKTGKEVLVQALAAGHAITALVRSPHKITFQHAKLRIVAGDATDEHAIRTAIKDCDVVVSTLGAPTNTSLIATSTKAILAAAQHEHIKRIIILSSFAVNQSRLTPGAALLTNMLMKNILRDKQKGEDLLRASSIDWTIVYATRLTTKTTGERPVRVVSNQKVGLKSSIARRQVAAWILAELTQEAYLNKEVTISQ